MYNYVIKKDAMRKWEFSLAKMLIYLQNSKTYLLLANSKMSDSAYMLNKSEIKTDANLNY